MLVAVVVVSLQEAQQVLAVLVLVAMAARLAPVVLDCPILEAEVAAEADTLI